MPFYSRIGNALVSCTLYLRQMVYPMGLTIPYLYPVNGRPVLEVALALAILAAISILALVFLRKHPYFAVGWFWYLGMLVPVLGIVQITYYARADRYTYLPQIGLYIAAAWLVAEGCTRLRLRPLWMGCLSAAIMAALVFSARIQTSYWKNNQTLWTHTIAVIPNNTIAYNDLGLDFQEKGQLEEALAYFQKAIDINPEYEEGHANLGNILLLKGRLDDSLFQYRKALEINPKDPEAYYDLGVAFFQGGQTDEAIIHFQKALEMKPDFAEAHNNLGAAFNKKGQIEDAIFHYRRALEINPDLASAHGNLGNILLPERPVGRSCGPF